VIAPNQTAGHPPPLLLPLLPLVAAVWLMLPPLPSLRLSRAVPLPVLRLSSSAAAALLRLLLRYTGGVVFGRRVEGDNVPPQAPAANPAVHEIHGARSSVWWVKPALAGLCACMSGGAHSSRQHSVAADQHSTYSSTKMAAGTAQAIISHPANG